MRKKIVRTRLATFVAANATGERVLDLGCGGSRYADHFPERIGVDLVPSHGVAVVADAHFLPLRDGSFGIVLSTEMLEHTREPQRVVDEILRVVRSGGRALVTTRFLFPIHDAPHDYFRFTRHGLRYLFRSWSHVEIAAETGPFESIAILFQRMSFQSDFRGGQLVGWLFLVLAQVLRRADRLVKRQYGDFHRSTVEPEALTSGYHVVATR